MRIGVLMSGRAAECFNWAGVGLEVGEEVKNDLVESRNFLENRGVNTNHDVCTLFKVAQTLIDPVILLSKTSSNE